MKIKCNFWKAGWPGCRIVLLKAACYNERNTQGGERMQYREEFSWILDKVGMRLNGEEEYGRNIEFVHSLGLKCDCVGWCTMEIGTDGAEEILEKIAGFCRSDGWKLRGNYARRYVDIQSDWYVLKCDHFRGDDVVYWDVQAPFEDGSQQKLCSVKAYADSSRSPRACGAYTLVSERFRDVCMEHGVPGVEFCWVRDRGRYAAEQYFMLFAERKLEHIGVGSGLGISRHRFDPLYALQRSLRYRQLGGSLTGLEKICYDLHVMLPDLFLASELPEGGIVYAHRLFDGRHLPTILIHRDIAELLLREKALPARDLIPAPVVQEWIAGYSVEACCAVSRPTREFSSAMLTEYEKLKESPRPVRQATEKMALKQLRAAKRNEGERFGRALPRKKAELLQDTDYAPLVPYYLVCDGGQVSDEYRFLSLVEAQAESAGFCEEIKREELLEEKPSGVVFGSCADGDLLLLRKDGGVCRFSHEAPEVNGEWPGLAQFFVDELDME